MPPFPPIFAYVIFGVLDFLALILDFVLGIGILFSSFSTFLYILWVFFRYGPGKASEKLFNLKNKTGKKLMKILGGSIIPFVNVWAVHDDYKQEKREYKNKELGIVEDDSESDSGGFLKKALLAAAVVSTGGAAAGAIAGEATVAGEAAMATEGSALSTGEAVNIGTRSGKMIQNNLGRGFLKQKNKMTIQEEIGGVKTGLNREDYDVGIKNYGDFNTYIKENKEKEEEKKRQEEDRKQKDEAKRIQGLKVEQDLRTEMIERSKRRYGEDSDQVRKMTQENSGSDDYREVI